MGTEKITGTMGRKESDKDVESPEPRKSDVTRERILRAAREVFAVYPYNAASIRMIGKVGGFDHPLIHYYFPSKASLFEAVVAEICEEFYLANISWFEGLERMSPRKGMPIYLDRFLDYNFKHPEPLRIIMLNIAQIDRPSEIPGYHYIPEVFAKIRGTFEEKVRVRGTSEDVEKFLNSFNTLVFSYLGASCCQAQVLEMEPDSQEYRQWIKDTLIYLFLPRLEKLIFPDKDSADKGNP